ncbi:PAS domain S-box-containing protein/diguanylate cyclase (GGDEF) domain-containing protein [Fontimonas thermophila]|uniref:PAS domain S-box-containing protein/diguanylate cyclase (GGDEF) domain-containing protein n=1 Tax=Fontimonas thermophila TaxID=1076937 RepID=A0A1I2JWJ1_9GAMM|nr:sensor domain-containing diguanylate cyclase [Fontimonas thermophila]SFF57407.1 PAS domain S-box-containing protein/diguanylate cyclase (GGDEF) domain-containing protein [Fontimonas thermophila]
MTIAAWTRRWLPRSIVGRTTLAIITLAVLLGALFTGLATWLLYGSEKARLTQRLDALLSTVEKTVSVACFVKDEVLAREIVAGLMSNDIVAGARIVADGVTLSEQTRSGALADHRDASLAITHPVYSPFDTREQVGEIVLYASRSTLHELALNYIRYVVFVIGLEVALMALAVAWVVYNLITRPIKSISDELHRLELRTGMRLRVPRRNEKDELGRLVSDVNALIARLTALIDTERRLRLEREANERRLALIFEKVHTGIFEIERSGLLRSWNPAFVHTLGPPPEPPQLQALLPQHAEQLRALIDDSLATGAVREADLELSGSDGSTRWVELSLTPVDETMLQGVVDDITERKHAELAARQLAVRDTLTGVLNRRGLEAGLASVFERRKREPGLAVALLLIDLDHFKQANDTHGHAAGDAVLRHVAGVLERAVRRTDLVARLGGDEFVVALVGIDGLAKAERIARSIVDEIQRPIALGDGVQVQIGASVGVAMAAPADASAAAVLARADAAMYAAKQAGRGRVGIAPMPGGTEACAGSPASGAG